MGYDPDHKPCMKMSGGGKTTFEVYAMDLQERTKSWTTTWVFEAKRQRAEFDLEKKGVKSPEHGIGQCKELRAGQRRQSAEGELAERTTTYSLQQADDAEEKPQIAVCFCGPPGLAHTLNETVGQIGGQMEFSAHSQ